MRPEKQCNTRSSWWVESVAMVVFATVPWAGVVQAQSTLGTDAPPQFEVVSIKPHDPADRMMWVQIAENTYTATGISLSSLIQNAYGVDLSQDGVAGLPSSLKDARYDIRAKMDAETAARVKAASGEDRTKLQHAVMLAMLEDRFKMKAHVVTNEAPVYALVVAKGGPKLKPFDPNSTADNPAFPAAAKMPEGAPRGGRMMMSIDSMTAEGVEAKTLAVNLQGLVHRKVIDQTGLTGRYDFTLKWNRDDSAAVSGSDTGPSLFTALQEQLGLKLESTRGPVTSVVVDHIEAPSEN